MDFGNYRFILFHKINARITHLELKTRFNNFIGHWMRFDGAFNAIGERNNKAFSASMST